MEHEQVSVPTHEGVGRPAHGHVEELVVLRVPARLDPLVRLDSKGDWPHPVEEPLWFPGREVPEETGPGQNLDQLVVGSR